MGITTIIKSRAAKLSSKLRVALGALAIGVMISAGAAFTVPNEAGANPCCDWVFQPGYGWVYYCWCNADGPVDNGL